MMARRPRAPVPRRIAWSAIGLERVVGELQLDAVELEEPLVLLDQRVARLGEDAHQRLPVEVAHAGDDRQPADELGDHAELQQVLGHARRRRRRRSSRSALECSVGAEADALRADAGLDDLLQAGERAAAR